MARIRLPRVSQIHVYGFTVVWVLGAVIGLGIGYFKADSRNAAAHKRWGNPIIGTLRFDSYVVGEEYSGMYRLVFHDPTAAPGESDPAPLGVLMSSDSGPTVKLWKDSNGHLFVQGSRYIGHPSFFRAWRNEPWPNGIADYLSWMCLGSLVGEALGWLIFVRRKPRFMRWPPPKGKQPVPKPEDVEVAQLRSTEAA